VRSRGRIVGGPQAFGWEFILLTVVHATWGKVLSSLDISASRSLSTLTATEEGECGENDVSETHYTDGSDEPDDETLVLTLFARVEVALHTTLHTTVVVAGGGAVVVVAGSAVVAAGSAVVWRGRFGVPADVLLELLGGLISTVEATTLGTFLQGVGDVIGDQFGNLLNLGRVDIKGSGDNFSGQTKKSLSDLTDAWERVGEESNEGDRFTMVVEFKVDGTLREESGLVGVDLVEDEFGTVLRYHTGDEGAIGDIVEFCRPRVCVGDVHAAWSKETDSDRDIVPDCGRHTEGMGGGAETTGTNSLSGGIHKVVLECLIGEEGNPCKVGWGIQELCDELVIPLGGNGGESDGGKDEKL
jgi:hypothetical protein